MRSNPNRRFLEIQVEDTGIGIKKEDMTKLIKLFGFLESTKELNTKGIGLGLHITKKITKMFDGNIVCHSNYGHGSNFIFIVAIGQNINDLVSNYHCDRIMNPEQKIYQKIKIFERTKKHLQKPRNHCDKMEMFS